MKILLIEDDFEVSSFVSKRLVEAGHAVETADKGDEGLKRAKFSDYDLMIIDRMLPNLDGLSIIKDLRASGNLTPILILSTLGDVDDRVKGLRSGGDDYLVKPFSFPELLARIEVMHARNSRNDSEQTKLKVQDLEMDLLKRTVMRAGKEIELQAREFTLLEYFLKHKGQVVTRTMLLENVWEYHFDPQTNVIDVHISRLRNKIDKGFEKPILKTVRGTGYIVE